MKFLLALACAAEAATGFILFVYPPIVIQLLFGTEVAGAGVVIGRFAGIALMALGFACWPAHEGRSGANRALEAMLGYSILATFFLGYLGIVGDWAGLLLWPAVAVHALLTIVLARAWWKA